MPLLVRLLVHHLQDDPLSGGKSPAHYRDVSLLSAVCGPERRLEGEEERQGCTYLTGCLTARLQP
jgi:hypothetical protein